MIKQGKIKPPEERKARLKWWRRIDTIAKLEMWLSKQELKAEFKLITQQKSIQDKIKYAGLLITAYAMQYYVRNGMMHLPQAPDATQLMDNLTGYIEYIDVMDDDEIKVTLVVNNPDIRKIIEDREFVHFTIKGKENDNTSLH